MRTSLTRLVPALALATLPAACVPPEEPVVTELGIDIEASHVGGTATLNGGAFPGSAFESGVLALQGAHPDDVVTLGPTYDPGYDAFVVNGLYDARYEFANGGVVVPVNARVDVLEGQGIGDDTTMPLDVGAVFVAASFTLNGAPFPASHYDSARFYLQRVGSEDLILLGDSFQDGALVKVAPGTYDVIYDYQNGSISPINHHARVMQHVEVGADTQLAIDVVASPVRLLFTLDGNPFPQSQYDDATFSLRDQATGAESLLMNSHAPVPSVVAIDGTYDVIYRHETGDDVPLNEAAVVVDDFVLAGGGAIARDIASVTFDATVTLNGSPFPVSQYDDGNILLHDARTGTDTPLGNTHSPFTGLKLIPGTYDVLYSHETGDDVPQNTRGTVAAGVVIDGGPLVVDVRGVQVTADISLDGEPFPASQYDDATFVLAGTPSSEDILVGNSHDPLPSVMVLPGTYDLYYRHETGAGVPQNTNYRLFASQVVGTDTTLTTNIETRHVRLAATLNHAPFPTADVGVARIHAQTADGDAVVLLSTDGAPGVTTVIAGDYAFYYEYVSGTGVPANPWALAGERTVD